MADGCIFCRIVSKELGAEIVYEDSSAVAFLDINPITPGHTIVVSKKHVASILELDDGDIGSIFAAVKRVMSAIQEGMKPAGFNYGVNHGRAAGQAIEHFQIHILPRFENDGGGSMHSVVRNPPKQQTIEEVAGIIRGAGNFKEPSPTKEEPKPEPQPKHESEIEKDLKKLEEEIQKHLKTFKRMKRP